MWQEFDSLIPYQFVWTAGSHFGRRASTVSRLWYSASEILEQPIQSKSSAEEYGYFLLMKTTTVFAYCLEYGVMGEWLLDGLQSRSMSVQVRLTPPIFNLNRVLNATVTSFVWNHTVAVCYLETRCWSNGKTPVSKTEDEGSIPSHRANFQYARLA